MNKIAFENKTILFDIDYTLFNTRLYRETNLATFRLFDEVEVTLHMLAKQAKLGIFSEGKREFQERKLKQTGIYELFDPQYIFIVPDKLEALREVIEIFRGQGGTFMVDDKLSILAEIKSVLPQMTTIWVKRGYYAERAEPIPGFRPDTSVDTIQDLPNLFTH